MSEAMDLIIRASRSRGVGGEGNKDCKRSISAKTGSLSASGTACEEDLSMLNLETRSMVPNCLASLGSKSQSFTSGGKCIYTRPFDLLKGL